MYISIVSIPCLHFVQQETRQVRARMAGNTTQRAMLQMYTEVAGGTQRIQYNKQYMWFQSLCCPYNILKYIRFSNHNDHHSFSLGQHDYKKYNVKCSTLDFCLEIGTKSKLCCCMYVSYRWNDTEQKHFCFRSKNIKDFFYVHKRPISLKFCAQTCLNLC